MTPKEKSQYYKDIENFKSKGNKVLFLPPFTFDVLYDEVSFGQRLVLNTPSACRSVLIDSVYIFASVDSSNPEDFLKTLMAKGIADSPEVSSEEKKIFSSICGTR